MVASSVPTAWKTREIDFPGKRLTAVTIPWGDVAGTYHSTGIQNIEVYVAMPPGQVRSMRRMRWLLPLASFGPIQHLHGGVSSARCRDRARRN